MCKQILLVIAFFQLSFSSWSQMELFNRTYDFNGSFISNAWLEMLVHNDTLILLGSSKSSLNTSIEIGLIPISNSNAFSINSLWFSSNTKYTPGLGTNFWKSPTNHDLFITGAVKSNNLFSNGFICKTNIYGDSLNVFHSEVDTSDFQSSIYNHINGTITSAGAKVNANNKLDLWLVKYDTSGTLIWENTFGGVESEVSYSLDKTHDGGYVIAGFTRSYGAGMRDVYVIKTDSMGVLQWQSVFGDSDNDAAFTKSLENGDILLYGGSVDPITEETSSFMRKIDSLGNLKWHKKYGYSLNFDDALQAIEVTFTGYLLAGFSVDSTDNNPLGWLLKTDFNGNELWSRRFRKRDSDNYFRDVLELPNGDIMLCGFVFSEDTLSQDAWLVRTNCLGFDTLPKANAQVEVLAEGEIRLENLSKAWGNCIIDWGDGTSNYVYEDYSTLIEHSYPNSEERTIKITAMACGAEDTMYITIVPSTVYMTKETLDQFSLYPNPAYERVSLKIPAFQEENYVVSFYNNLGKKMDISPTATSLGFDINTSTLPPGIYHVVLTHKNGMRSNKKLVIQD